MSIDRVPKKKIYIWRLQTTKSRVLIITDEIQIATRYTHTNNTILNISLVRIKNILRAIFDTAFSGFIGL